MPDPLRRCLPPARGARLSRPLDRSADDLRGISGGPSGPRCAVLELGDLTSAECGVWSAALREQVRSRMRDARLDGLAIHSAFHTRHSALLCLPASYSAASLI